MNITSLNLHEAASLIAKYELSPLELTQAHLNRIEAVDPQLNSFITPTPESALRQAGQAEEELQRGEYRGPIHGIPLAVKDLFDTVGVRTTAGAKLFSDNIPKSDAAVIGKLRSSGAALLGKLNMHEIALGVTNENPHFGDCKNPWNLAHSPGGSSGGSGAALAGGLCMGALGSDTGGSIRIPAALCGIVGLKPTFGRVSKRGVIPLSWSLDHVGPMARCVRDVALLLEALAGYDPDDPDSVEIPKDDYLGSLEDGVHGWKIALASDNFFNRAEEGVRRAVRSAAEVFEHLGARVSEVELPWARDAARANGQITTSEAATFHRERLESQPENFGRDVLERLQVGAAVSTGEYISARRTQVMARRKFKELFQDYDLLLTPTTAIPAPLRGGADAVERAKQLLPFTSPFNLTGLPALSLPCGFTQKLAPMENEQDKDISTATALPIGLQIVAPWWSEARILRGAFAYETATDWNLRKPLTSNP